MRYLYLKLKNYIGIYNGLGLEEIEIDFTKCKHKTVLIKGRNGSGKSTLFNALHMMPDTNDCFIPGKPAGKLLGIQVNDLVYHLRIVHDINKHGQRETTKAFITKIDSFGEEQDLNPNGNVTSFKDALFLEFNLDPNFVALSQLSSGDRGLADKKPVERKKFINSIISNLDFYNNTYKVLNKRSTVFKSMMNSLVTKIDNIGNEDKLILSLESLENRLNNLLNSKDSILEELASNKTKIKLIDPDGMIQSTYNTIYNNINEINSKYNTLQDKYNAYMKVLNIENMNEKELFVYIDDIKKSISDLEIFIRVTETNINNLLADREREAKDIQTKSAKLTSLTSDKNFNNIKQSINDTKKNIDSYLNIIQSIGIEDIFSISKDEFIIGLTTLKEIKECISNTTSFYDYDILYDALEFVKQKSYPDLQSIDNDILQYTNKLQELSLSLQEYNILHKVSEKLNMRPTDCTIDTCEFIKDAVIAFNKEPLKNISIIENNITKYNDLLSNKHIEKERTNQIIECVNILRSMIRNIETHISIINKLPVADLFIDKEMLYCNILNKYNFKEIDILYSYIEYANIIEEYKRSVNILNELEIEYKVYEEKSKIIDDIISEIDILNEKLNKITDTITNNSKEISDAKNNLSLLQGKLCNANILLEIVREQNDLMKIKNEELTKFSVIKSNIMAIKESADNINMLNSRLDTINKEISPVIDDRDKIKHGLSLLKEYKEELKLYTMKYNKVEVIKKHSSPSKGIQTLFMEVYMNKTISLTNELLQLLFDGEFSIPRFVINDNEFNIPCYGSGLPHDDISSMSTSQICMISMILSFVLLHQSSTVFNILKMDEIDGGLDTMNRLIFFDLLDKINNILDTEQVFIISHNSEFDYSNCDIIQLKSLDNDVSEGNVIYRY